MNITYKIGDDLIEIENKLAKSLLNSLPKKHIVDLFLSGLGKKYFPSFLLDCINKSDVDIPRMIVVKVVWKWKKLLFKIYKARVWEGIRVEWTSSQASLWDSDWGINNLQSYHECLDDLGSVAEVVYWAEQSLLELGFDLPPGSKHQKPEPLKMVVRL